MPISRSLVVPPSAKQLPLPDSASRAFLVFISSEDPETKQPWCPDVRASWPHIQAAFGGDEAPTVSVVQVGQRPECVSSLLLFATHVVRGVVLKDRQLTR